MKSIVKKWVLTCMGIGLIPVFMLGASPGGVVLSPVILAVCAAVGLIGASVHIDSERCLYRILYNGEAEKFTFILSEYGKLHFDLDGSNKVRLD